MSSSSPPDEQIKDNVKEYYGKRVKTSADFQFVACPLYSNDVNKVPSFVKDALKLCHDEVVSKYYGCGLVFPEELENTHVLDLGSGSGRDCFILSKLVGENGHIIGVDMTQEQLDVATKYIDYHKEKFGYSKANTEFIMGDIENLQEAGVKDSSVDIIVSNCVIDLTSNKKAVFQEAYRVLKDGGEVYFSDMYADRHVPDIKKHELYETLWGEGFAGALWWKELVDLCKEVGLSGPYFVSGYSMGVKKEELKKVLGDAKYVAATYRLFKTPRSDDSTDYYQATYKGSIKGHPEDFKFDVYTTFKTGKTCDVTANVAEIIRQSRFAKHFDLSAKATSTSELPDPYAIADPFKGLGIETGAESGGSCCGPTGAESAGSCCVSNSCCK